MAQAPNYIMSADDAFTMAVPALTVHFLHAAVRHPQHAELFQGIINVVNIHPAAVDYGNKSFLETAIYNPEKLEPLAKLFESLLKAEAVAKTDAGVAAEMDEVEIIIHETRLGNTELVRKKIADQKRQLIINGLI